MPYMDPMGTKPSTGLICPSSGRHVYLVRCLSRRLGTMAEWWEDGEVLQAVAYFSSTVYPP